MKSSARLAMALAAVCLPFSSFATIISGDLTGGGAVSGFVTSSNSWVQSNPVDGSEVNFWTLNAQAADLLSIVVTSPQLEFGVSIYQGLVDPLELLIPGFDNGGNFGDNIFIAGTPTFGALGTSLLDIALPFSGLYTIAVGGEGFGFNPGYAYDMDVSVTSVPEPAAAGLFAIALAALGVVRRRA